MKASLFALLQICQSDEFITKEAAQTNSIKEGVVKYMQFESQALLD